MPTLTLDQCTIHYQQYNQKNGDEHTKNSTPIVLLHANPGDSQDYAAVIPALTKNHTVIAFDWPGYGGLSGFHQPVKALPSISPILFYDILLECLAALNITQAHVIGNSIGGNVAARLAATKPDMVKSLVLVSPGGFTKHNPLTKLFCQYQGSKFGLSAHPFAQLYLRKRNPTTKAMLKRAKTVQSSAEAAALSRAMWQSFKTEKNNLLSLAKNITAPTLLFFGKYDPLIPAITDGRQAQKCIRHAQKQVLPCGHAAFAEMPEAFLQVVEPFLDKQI